MRYFIRQQGEHVSGPHDLHDIQGWIKEGKVRQEMEFSVDQIDWIWGIELPDLFARKQRSAARPRTRRRRRAV